MARQVDGVRSVLDDGVTIEHFEEVGWMSERTWVAHCICPNAEEIGRMGRWGTGVAHCPSSNLILGGGLAPVGEFRAAGVPVGLGCDGSASADSASLWLEARTAMRAATPISTWSWIRLTARSSATSESISTPRFIGPGCITRTCGAARPSFSRSRP